MCKPASNNGQGAAQFEDGFHEQSKSSSNLHNFSQLVEELVKIYNRGLVKWFYKRIIIETSVFDRMVNDFKSTVAVRCWMLYCFYFKMARKQKTNCPYVSNSYVVIGLGWGDNQVKHYKRLLIQHGYIAMKKVGSKWYVKVNHMPRFRKFRLGDRSRGVKAPPSLGVKSTPQMLKGSALKGATNFHERRLRDQAIFQLGLTGDEVARYVRKSLGQS